MNHFLLSAAIAVCFAFGLFVVCWGVWTSIVIGCEYLDERKRNKLRMPYRAKSRFETDKTQ